MLKLVSYSELTADGSNEAPYLGVGQRGDLMRFAAVSAKMLAKEAARECDRLNGTADGRARMR